MKSMKVKFVLLLLIAGVLSACASPATQADEAPASLPTETTAPATEAPTSLPAATDTSAPAAVSSPTAEIAAGATVSFATDILPLLENRCVNCHGGEKTQEGLSLKSHAELMTGSENGVVLVPGDASNSLLVQLVSEGKMPKRGPKLTPDQVQLIVDWINQGALDN
jgi:uncharacterized membrane protein